MVTLPKVGTLIGEMFTELLSTTSMPFLSAEYPRPQCLNFSVILAYVPRYGV